MAGSVTAISTSPSPWPRVLIDVKAVFDFAGRLLASRALKNHCIG
ncbi:MAG TPA: hypothetical protein VEY30_00340 [Myxococcaceae bacterium]|nr:hypothetical protein [Myxococcaceae bacterium]